MHPLHNLWKKNVPCNWSKAQEAAFKAVKDEISKATKLSYYDPTMVGEGTWFNICAI